MWSVLGRLGATLVYPGVNPHSQKKMYIFQNVLNDFNINPGSSWGHVGAILAHLRVFLVHLGSILGHLWALGSRHRLAIPFAPGSGPKQGSLGAIWGHFGAISGAMMARDSSNMASRWPNMGSRWAKDVPKMVSIWTKMAARWPQRPLDGFAVVQIGST